MSSLASRNKEKLIDLGKKLPRAQPDFVGRERQNNGVNMRNSVMVCILFTVRVSIA